MTLAKFILKKMKKHQNKIAFKNTNITYKELIKIIKNEAKKYKTKNKLIVANTTNKQQQAIEILSILFSKNVVVPINDSYGIKASNYQKSIISKDKKSYKNLAFIMFSSGTTSTSKGVMLTHKNVIENIKGIKKYFVKDNQTILIYRPLVHISGLVGELLFGLYCGYSIYFYDELLHPLKINQIIEQEKISMIGMSPTILKGLLQKKCQLSSLKNLILSGEKLDKNLALRCSKCYPNISFYNVYGMTENSPRATYLEPKYFNKYPGSVGKPLKNTKIKIINDEICIKSKSIMKGYYKNNYLTKKKIKKGYYYTGDIGYFDTNGFLYVVGRKDNLIIKSGFNIYPEEIENIVNQFDNVYESLVYKIDNNDDIKVGLKVVGDINKYELYQYLIKNLPIICLPDVIDVVDCLDKTISGKIKR